MQRGNGIQSFSKGRFVSFVNIHFNNTAQIACLNWDTHTLRCLFVLAVASYQQWRHQMETFSALLTICEGNLLVTGGFPSHRPVMRSFDVCFDMRLNKRLCKQSRRWWFETPSRSLWRHCNALVQRWGLLKAPFVNSGKNSGLKSTCQTVSITLIFDRCHRSLAVATPVKYECDIHVQQVIGIDEKLRK